MLSAMCGVTDSLSKEEQILLLFESCQDEARGSVAHISAIGFLMIHLSPYNSL